jgi:hypothetical protein
MEGIKMDPEKGRAMQDWEPPSNLKDVCVFLGCADFYYCFICNYSCIVQPLTFLTHKGVLVALSIEQQMAFNTLKATFTSVPVLAHFDPDQDIIVEMDASDYVSTGVLSQYDNDNVLYPMAYFSKKHSLAECNYEIYDKELMAIIRAFEEWHPELQSIINPIRVLSKHKDLEYFIITKLLNRHQAHWSQFLSQFNFKIVYRPSTASGKLDALSHRSRDLPKAGDNHSLENQTTIIKRKNIIQLSAMATPTLASPVLAQLFTDGYNEDPFPNKILKLLQDGAKHCREISLAEYNKHNNLLHYCQRIWVLNYEPLKLHLLQQHHDIPAAGHPGRSKTLEYLCQNYTWLKM